MNSASVLPHRGAILAAGFAAALLLPLLAGLLEIGLVADDFVHLVEDRLQPWYFSQDHLYRPLRNALMRVLPAVFGLDPVPYRLVAIALFLGCLALLYRLLLESGVGSSGALAGCAFAALYPRNGRVLCWFAAAQDLAVGVAVLTAAIGWTRSRTRGSKPGYLLALAAFALGLGFKEPAIVLPGLLLVLDVHREGWARLRSARFWRPYLGFAPVVVGYGAYLWAFRAGRLQTADEHGIYGAAPLLQSALALVRTGLNLLLPLARPFALRDVTAVQLGCALLIVLSAAAIAIATRTPRSALAAVAWVVIAALPTSLFARVNNGDQYLFLPLLGLAFGVAFTLDALFRREGKLAAAASVGLAVYAVLGAVHLRGAEREWRASGDTIARAARSLEALPEEAKAATAISAVGVPHSAPSGLPVLNNGLRGVLVATGFSRALTLDINHRHPGVENPRAAALARAVLACPISAGPADGRWVLVWTEAGFAARGGACAGSAVEASARAHPLEWAAQ